MEAPKIWTYSITEFAPSHVCMGTEHVPHPALDNVYEELPYYLTVSIRSLSLGKVRTHLLSVSLHAHTSS